MVVHFVPHVFDKIEVRWPRHGINIVLLGKDLKNEAYS